MTRRPFDVARRPLILLGLLSGLGIPPAFAAPEPQPGDLDLGYSVYVGGVHVLDAKAHLGWQETGYRIGLRAATDGFLGRVANWRADVASHGELRPGGLPRPVLYRSISAFRDEPRNTTVEYDGRTPRVTVAEPPPEQDREPVPDEMKPDTVDPMTAVVAVLQAVEQGRGCDVSVPVYDGRQRYDLIFKPTGREQIAPSNLSVFSGSAEACVIDYEPVAGEWRQDRRRQDRDEQRRSRNQDRNATVWLAAPRDGDPPVPVRAEIDSPLGTVVMHLSSITEIRVDERAELPTAR